jgi:hypothetical protein
MIGIQPYKKYIAKYAPLLLAKGFSLLTEDEYNVELTDGEVYLTFHVEPYSDALEVWVEYLSDSAPDTKYRLDIIMQVYLKKDLTETFRAETEDEKENLVKTYIVFIVQHKDKLFKETFPLAREYDEFLQKKSRAFFEHLEKLQQEKFK